MTWSEYVVERAPWLPRGEGMDRAGLGAIARGAAHGPWMCDVPTPCQLPETGSELAAPPGETRACWGPREGCPLHHQWTLPRSKPTTRRGTLTLFLLGADPGTPCITVIPGWENGQGSAETATTQKLQALCPWYLNPQQPHVS